MASGSADINIRRLEPGDLPAALAIQAACYPAFLREDAAAFASRLTVPASYCLAAERGGRLVGYLLAHGWASGSPPSIGTILDTDAIDDILYIHDLAIAPDATGLALGQRLLDRAFAAAHRNGYRSAELIAVEGAAGYWRRQGFIEVAPDPSLAAKVAAYGADARWMMRPIA